MINRLLKGKKKSSTTDPDTVNCDINKINLYFANIGANSQQLLRKSGPLVNLPPLRYLEFPGFTQVTSTDVEAPLEEINPQKASGPDGISGHLFRRHYAHLAAPLHDLTVSIIRTAGYSKILKRALLHPIHKS